MEHRPTDRPEGAPGAPAKTRPPRAGSGGAARDRDRRSATFSLVLAGDLAGAHIDAPVSLMRD